MGAGEGFGREDGGARAGSYRTSQKVNHAHILASGAPSGADEAGLFFEREEELLVRLFPGFYASFHWNDGAFGDCVWRRPAHFDLLAECECDFSGVILYNWWSELGQR